MYKILTKKLFLFGIFVLFVASGFIFAGKVNAATTANVLTDFENGSNGDAMSTTTITSSTHHETTWGTWSMTDASSVLSVNTSGEQTTLTSITVNGTTYNDAGSTRGMAYSLVGGHVAWVEFTPTTAQSSMSVGMWYKTTAPASFTSGPTFLRLNNVGFGSVGKLVDRKNSGSNVREIALIAVTTVTIPVSDNTWYWVTVKYIKNSSSCQFALYNTSGVQVGTTQTFTCTNSTITSVMVGSQTAATAAAQTAYYDDLVLDWTNSVFPLGIPSSDTTAPTVTAFTIPSTSNSLTVPITAFAATDDVGVTGYLVNRLVV